MSAHEQLLLKLTEQELARFWCKVWKLGDACWPWIGAVIKPEHGDHSGYGCLTIRRQSFRAHRVAYILSTGKVVQTGLDVCHSCDYRRCCNPAHLEAKTREQNVADKMARGRHQSQGFVYVEPPMPVVPDEVRVAGLRDLLVVNFWARVPTVRKPDECWEWLGSRKQHDYGRIELKCRALGVRIPYLAHRLSYELHHSVPPQHLSVRHECDNPPCVNPAHLKLGTHQDNMNDRTVRGRTFRPTGVLSGRNKIGTDADAMRIRELVAAGAPRRVLAIEYGVHVQTIHDVVSGKSWKHLPLITPP